LEEKGYEVEERESIISDLNENSKKIVSQLPKFSKIPTFRTKFTIPYETSMEYTPEDQNLIRSTLEQTLQNDPSTNLILLRKEFENKNIDWNTFKTALDELILEGKIHLNDDQSKHLDDLDQPPLDLLDQLLYKLGFRGK
jgi:hypothetical protein